MILYIDETENEKYFIVAGLLVSSNTIIEKSYKSFKKTIDKARVKERYKAKLFTEFKSSILDKDYQKIKIKMLQAISKMPGLIIYACYTKRETKMNQTFKESIYIDLLESIVNSIKENVEIVFDSFNKLDFESNIKLSIKRFKNAKSIISKDSQLSHGLQFADNICSVIRLYRTHGLKSDKVKSFYPIIKAMIKEANDD